jgi:hypothetical protein
MNRFINILFFVIAIGLFNKVKAQTNNLFEQHEMDSMNFYFTPLYSTDSVDITSLLNYKFINIYFLNGECSLCLSKMSEAETFYKAHEYDYLETLFIVETSDTILFNFYRDKFNITTKILWDENYRLNEQTINTCFLIDNFGNIIIEGDFINDEKKQMEYIELIKHVNPCIPH